MPKEIIIFDTEYLTDTGVMARAWGGIFDTLPLLVEIGGYKVSLEHGLPIKSEFFALINPKNTDGSNYPISEYFQQLTGITEENIRKNGKNFADIMNDFTDFIGKNNAYSYGNDFFRPILPSCYHYGINCQIPIQQAKDIRKVFIKCGIAEEVLKKSSSGSISEYFGLVIDKQYGSIHDARFDALSLITTLQYLEKTQRLNLDWLK